MLRVGNHLVEDFSWIFGLKGPEDGIVEHAEYQVAVERLMKAGYQVRDTEKGWKQFAELRSKYASPLNQRAHWLVVPPAEWTGRRSSTPPQAKRAPPSRPRTPPAAQSTYPGPARPPPPTTRARAARRP